MAGVAQLKAMVGMDASAYKAGAKGIQNTNTSMKDSFKSIGAAIGVGFSVVAIKAAVKMLADYASTLSDAAMNMGLLTEEMMALNQVATENGMDINGVSKMMAKLQGRLYDAIKGDALAAEGFEDLGLSFEKLVKLNPVELFEEIARAAVASEMPLEALAEIFGEKLGPQAVQAIKQIAQDGLPEMNKAIADSIDTLKAWGSGWDGTWLKIKNGLSGALVEVVNFSDRAQKSLMALVKGEIFGSGPGGSFFAAAEAWNKSIAADEEEAAQRRAEREKQIADSVKAKQEVYLKTLNNQLAALDEKKAAREEGAGKHIKSWEPSLTGLEKAGASFGGTKMAGEIMRGEKEDQRAEAMLQATKDIVAEIKVIQDRIEVVRGGL